MNIRNIVHSALIMAENAVLLVKFVENTACSLLIPLIHMQIHSTTFAQKSKTIIWTCTSQLITEYTNNINFILTSAETKAQNISAACPEVLLKYS
jgi:hypothetical protein